MKVAIIFTAIRVLEIGEPEGSQSKEDFLQSCKEGVIDDPFSFVDVGPTEIEVQASVTELK